MEQRHDFEFSSGRLCLDFINTLGDRPEEQPKEEELHSYADLVAWGEAAGALSGEEAASLLREAVRRPTEATETFTGTIALREAMYRVFSAITTDAAPPEGDFARLNGAIRDAMARSRFAPAGEHFTWDWERDPAALDGMLWPVAWSAAELLTSEELGRVHECAGTDCSWLFVDMSKNGSRRWCEMRSCGNRAKARRHRERQRTAHS